MPTKNRSVKKQDAGENGSSQNWTSPQVDFPREGESVGVGHYAIRISAEAGSDVEISIDKGEWCPCRYGVGHWWFDWNPLEANTVSIQTRARLGEGKWKTSPAVKCHVKKD